MSYMRAFLHIKIVDFMHQEFIKLFSETIFLISVVNYKTILLFEGS